MRDYKKLEVWKKAHAFTKQIYEVALPQMPQEERFALTNQIRRAAYSIPLNIVEGCGKNTNKDFARFLDNALGSAHEVEYACFLCFDLNYLSNESYKLINGEINEVKAMLIALIKYLRDNE